MDHQLDKQVLVETIGSILWFVMDGFWMLNQAIPAKAMIVPIILVNLFVFRYTKPSLSPYAVVAAMNSWLVMNICWMVGDLDKNPAPVAIARGTFLLGMAFLVLAVAKDAGNPERLAKVLAHFRRLRI